MALDTLQRLPRGGRGKEMLFRSFIPISKESQVGKPLIHFAGMVLTEAINPNRAMKRVNRVFDKAVNAISAPERDERLRRIREFERDMETRQQQIDRPSRWLGLLAGNRASVTDVAADTVVDAMVPSALRNYDKRIDEQEMQERLEQVAIAIGGYRAEDGKYPKSLELLEPTWIDSVRRDIFASGNESVRYLVERDRVAVYSLGPNKQDDGGKETESDIVIEWKLE